jgi:hypothetical protein
MYSAQPMPELSFSFVIVFLHAARMYVSEGEDETEA